MAKEEVWHNHWMTVAHITSLLSRDPSTQVGAVITSKNNKQCSLGYNGPPSGFDDSKEDWDDRSIKMEMVIHAEENALLNCPFDKQGCKIYVTHKPCHRCLIRIYQAGIREVYWRTDYDKIGFSDLWLRVSKNFVVIRQI